MNYIYCARLSVNLRYYGSVCEFLHVCELFSINNNNYYLKRLNFKNFVIRNNRKNRKLGPMPKCPRILFGRNPVWEESHVGGITCGRNPVWEESCGRNPVWEESCMGGIPWEESCVGGILCGRNPVWEESRVGGIPCGRNPVWEESRGRNPVGRNPVGGIPWGGIP